VSASSIVKRSRPSASSILASATRAAIWPVGASWNSSRPVTPSVRGEPPGSSLAGEQGVIFAEHQPVGRGERRGLAR